MNLDEQYMERFYKKVVNGKKGNLFTRVDALEEMLKHLQVRDVTQYITNLIQENKEIIIPSLVGGVTDPTDETFSGIVISPNGQTIDGVLYSFAIVVDGVVISGLGSDGTTVYIYNSIETNLVDGTYSGETESGTAGTALAFGELVYLQTSDSRWEKTDASAKATSCNKLGICVLVASGDGEPTKVLLRGNVRADAVFPAMTIGVPMYAGTTAGEIQASAPSSNAGEIIRHVGHANTADELYFNPSNDFFEIG